MKKYILLLLIAVLLPIKSFGQNVLVEAKIDTLEIMIGEQTVLNLKVTLDANLNAILPTFQDSIVKGVTVLSQSANDTLFVNEGKKMTLSRDYIITSFDSALYRIPPIEVIVDTITYKSNPLALKVNTIPLTEEDLNNIFGAKDVLSPPFLWKDWIKEIIMTLLLFPFIGLIIFFIIRLLDNKPIIRKVKVEKKLPAHTLAMQEIERIKQEKTLDKDSDVKKYYTQLTDIIRGYIKDRFGFNAQEMTSAEIIDELKNSDDKTAISELRDLLQTSDLVKFAKYYPEMRENDVNLMKAVEFINVTKNIEEENALKDEPDEITVVEKRTLRSKAILIASILILTSAVIYICVSVVSEVYFSFFSK